MCGIMGFYNPKEVLDKKKKKGIRKAFAALDMRGAHASGIAGAFGDTIWHYKKPVSSSQLVTHISFKNILDKSNCAIMHARFTTQGHEKNNQNNHPFLETMYDGSLVSLVHNGIISNYDKLKKRFKLVTDIETDSYIILHLVKLFYAKYKNMPMAITKATRWLDGSFALLFLHVTNKQPELYFLRHNNPLSVYDYNGCFVLGSTELILSKGLTLGKEYPIKENVLYILKEKIIKGERTVKGYSVNELKIYKPIVKKYVYNNNYNGGYDEYDGYNGWYSGRKWCGVCNKYVEGTTWDYDKHVMACPDCHSKDKKSKLNFFNHNCEDCGKKEATTKYRSDLEGYICDECYKGYNTDAPSTSVDCEICGVKQDTEGLSMYRSKLKMTVCDDCLLEALSETLTAEEIVKLTVRGAVKTHANSRNGAV